MRGERCAAAGAVGNDFKALVHKALFVNLLECPPLRLDKVVVVCDIGVVHVGPETYCAGEVLPHAFVFPYVLFALLDKGLETVCFNLFFSVDTDLFLNFELYGETVCVPARLTRNIVALHCTVSRNHILDNTG